MNAPFEHEPFRQERPGEQPDTGSPEAGSSGANQEIPQAPQNNLIWVDPHAGGSTTHGLPLGRQEPPEIEPRLFETWFQPEIHPPTRTPHLGHLCLLGLLALFGLLAASIAIQLSLSAHLFGATTLKGAITEVHYTLGSEAILYLVTLAECVVIFPMVWHKSFFAGLQWNARRALRVRRRLISAAFLCFLLALLNGILLPGPENTPIDKIFRAPGAAWLLFAFGVTFAPFFEEMIFRGFLLPSLCTTFDWSVERFTHIEPRPLDENGHPQWTLTAMVVGAICTSIPFALMHGAQTGYSFGPFILLVCVSMVLCWARLSTKSLAASVMIHACYNFLLFTLMLIGTSGFQHLEKM